MADLEALVELEALEAEENADKAQPTGMMKS